MINAQFFASSSLLVTAWSLQYKLGEGSRKSPAVPESVRQSSGEQSGVWRCADSKVAKRPDTAVTQS